MPTSLRLTAKRLQAAGLGTFFRPVDLEAIGVSEPMLRRFVREGAVEKVARGLYRLRGAAPTEHHTLAAVCARVPRGILCLLTALRVHGIGTSMSPDVWLALPRGIRDPKVDVAVLRVVRFTEPFLRVGVVKTRIEGVAARITDPARTVVDCLRLSRLVDRETALEALRDALADRHATPARILSVARACRAGERVRHALEVLGA